MSADKYAVSPAVPEREIDAQIAETVFGYWDVGMYEGGLVHGETNMNGWPMPTPHYSTDLAAAMEAAEVVISRGIALSLSLDGTWFARFADEYGTVGAAFGKTLPLAICLATLDTIRNRNAKPDTPSVKTAEESK